MKLSMNRNDRTGTAAPSRNGTPSHRNSRPRSGQTSPSRSLRKLSGSHPTADQLDRIEYKLDRVIKALAMLGRGLRGDENE